MEKSKEEVNGKLDKKGSRTLRLHLGFDQGQGANMVGSGSKVTYRNQLLPSVDRKIKANSRRDGVSWW